MLQERQYRNLRLNINANVAHREQMLLLGKIGLVMRSNLQEDDTLFTLESLRIPDQGMLTNLCKIHHRADGTRTPRLTHPPGRPSVPTSNSTALLLQEYP